ncbi:DUF4190 domain-containing protein [Planctomonas psychrotolerans]|uniref:DUF4190 domain-containing protein n=1 Tax=Planctomonas psychrotolerans TaxID=2528712 RepID=UPI001D0D3147|nr:DUF4190 domain-containing protein [Planctomonas psychrotolerans]
MTTTSGIPTFDPSSPSGPRADHPSAPPFDSSDPYGPGSAYATAYSGPASVGALDPKPLSLTSFWLGIASVVFSFTLFVPIAAIVLGFLARTREPSGQVYAIWGIVLGFVMAIGWALALIAAGGLALATLPFIAFL